MKGWRETSSLPLFHTMCVCVCVHVYVYVYVYDVCVFGGRGGGDGRERKGKGDYRSGLKASHSLKCQREL